MNRRGFLASTLGLPLLPAALAQQTEGWPSKGIIAYVRENCGHVGMMYPNTPGSLVFLDEITRLDGTRLYSLAEVWEMGDDE